MNPRLLLWPRCAFTGLRTRSHRVMTATALLAQILERALSPAAWQWAQESAQMLQSDAQERVLFMRFSAAIRHSGKSELDLDKDIRIESLPGWQPKLWRLDHALRNYLLLQMPLADAESWRKLLDRMFQAADLGEAEALYLVLPLLPHPQAHVARTSEGLRSNVKSHFEAVAHYSPLPAAQFDEQAWNQMVLKALFIESQLDPMVGLNERSNPQLTHMLCDYAHERWAASRAISPELWRCVARCPDAAAIADLMRVLEQGTEREQAAAALSIVDGAQPAALALLDAYPELHKQVTQGLCWADILANP